MITLDDTQARVKLDRLARELDEKKVRRAEVRALNRAVRGARTELSREIRDNYRIKSADVRDAVRLERAQSSQSVPTATLVVSSKPIPLVKFGRPRQVRKGVAVTVVRGKRQTIEGAFVVPSLGNNVFVRETASRLPIKKLFGPTVRQLAPQALKRADLRVRERVVEQLQRNIDRLIAKATQ